MLSTVKTILQDNELKPKKKLGQNFLINKGSIDKVLKATELKPSDIVLEVGPGLGALTLEMAKQVKQVIAIEKDTKLAEQLNNILKSENINNVKVQNADILKYSTKLAQDYKVISNLPYNIATAVIMKFLENANPPSLMVVMLQKEVGQRMVAKPPQMSKLAVFTQLYSTPKIIGYISKNSFYPRPKVDSTILSLKPYKGSPRQSVQGQPSRTTTNNRLFAKIVSASFAHPRKQLLGNLSRTLKLSRETTESWLISNKIHPKQRAETLTVKDWLNLTKSYPQPTKT